MKHWHIGILTKNIDQTLDILCSLPNVRREAWILDEIEFAPDEMIVGDGGKLRIAMGKIGGVAYELIQPLDDGSYHAKKLKLSGPGPHHNAYVCEDNLDEIAESLKAAGGRIVWEARHNMEHVYYIELPDCGLIWELIDRLPFILE